MNSVKKKEETKKKKAPRSRSSFGISRQAKDEIISNLSMLVGSGMIINDALDAMKKDIKSKRMQKIIDGMKEDIESGLALWKTMERSGLFSNNAISLIRIGEESGNLSKNLRVISEQQEKERDFRSKVSSAMAYPAFVLVLTTVVGGGIAWFILPKLALVFDQLKLELPLVTRILISFGSYLNTHGQIIIPSGALGIGLLTYIIFFAPKTKIIGQYFLFSIPGIKKLIQEIELARFGYLLGTLLQAGVPVNRALESLAQASAFPQYQKLYQYLKTSIEEGNSFQKSFAGYKRVTKLIPNPIQQLIFTGERSGHLAETLLSINKTYEAKTELTTKNLAVILEPILLVIVWLGVVAVAISVILPIYNLIGGLNQETQAPAYIEPKSEESTIETDTNEIEGMDNEQHVPSTIEGWADSISGTEELTEDQIESEDQIPSVSQNDIIGTLTILPTGIGFLNVRSQASISSEKVTTVTPGSIFSYLEEKDGWYHIQIDQDLTGWVYAQYVSIDEE